MTEILLTVMRMSATATVIAAVIILLRAVMKRVPGLKRKYSYALWAIVLVRLLCPVSVSSPVSLFNLFDTAIISQTAGEAAADIGEYTKYTKYTRSARYAEYDYRELPQAQTQSAAQPVNMNSADVTVNQDNNNDEMFGLRLDSQVILNAIAVVWMMGIVVMTICVVVSYVRVQSRIKGARLLSGNVYLCGNIETPFVFGICKPRIYIPESVAEEDYEYILAHERKHISRFDHILKPAAMTALILHWFNPAAWLCFRLMTEDMELSCDEGALESFVCDVKKEYASALLRMSVRQNGLTGGMLSFGESNIKSRIKGILKSRKPAVALSIAAIVVLIAAAVCLLTNAGQDKSIVYEDIVAKDYDSYYLSGSMWAALKVYGEPDADSMQRLNESMRKASAERIKEYEWDVASDFQTYAISVSDGEKSIGITFERGIVNGRENVPCCHISSYTEAEGGKDAYFTLDEESWNEIKESFISASQTGSLYSPYDTSGISDTEPVTDKSALGSEDIKTETAAPTVKYNDEVKLCKDYLTDYITSQFYGEKAFAPERYIADSDMFTFAYEANAYDRRSHKDDKFHTIVVHSEDAKRGEHDGRICLMIPFEVEYIAAYSPLSSYSGYGRSAYFEVESTDEGYRIYRALDFGAAVTYATGITEKEAAGLTIPVEFNIETAVSALLSQKKSADMSLRDYQEIEMGTSRDSIIKQFGEPVCSLFGMYGDIYESGEMRVIVYYDVDSKVENVLFSKGETTEDDNVKQLLHDFLRVGYYRDIMTEEEFEDGFAQGSFEYLGRSADYRFCLYEGLIKAPSETSIEIDGHTVTSDNQMMPSKMGIYVIGNDGSVSTLEDASLSKIDEEILYLLLIAVKNEQ